VSTGATVSEPDPQLIVIKPNHATTTLPKPLQLYAESNYTIIIIKKIPSQAIGKTNAPFTEVERN